MKGFVIAMIAVLIIVAVGLVEVGVLCKGYSEINSEVLVLMFKAEHNSISPEDMDVFIEKWECLREKVELFLPHIDVFECNVRISECKGFVKVGDYVNAYVQLTVVEELTRYYSHMLRPTFSHIL